MSDLWNCGRFSKSLLPRLVGPILLLVIFDLLLPTHAEAQICQPGRTVQIFVGDTASDAACHYNDIQSALNAIGSCPTQVNITRMHIWNNQHLSTGGKNVTLQGWGNGVTCFTLSQSCNSQVCPTPSSTAGPLVTLNGSGSGGRVLTVNGAASVVTLRHLIIRGGAAGGGDGGGVGFSGTGRLNLFTTVVQFNEAGYGAGINFKGTGLTADTAILTLLTESVINQNTASVSGGGIRIEGRAQLIAESPRTYIAGNVAQTGYGGGIEVIGPAEAYIGSPGYGASGVVELNVARSGGGIAVLAGEGDDLHAHAHLYSSDPSVPLTIRNNKAEIGGGAFYLRPHYNGFGEAKITTYGIRVENNQAPIGAVALMGSDPTSGDVDDLYVGSDLRIADDPPPRGAPGCPTESPCNRISGNKTRSLNDLPVPGGSLFSVNPTSTLVMKRSEIVNNEAANVVWVAPVTAGTITSAILMNCLVAKNNLTGFMFYQPGGGGASYLRLTSCTIADNTLPADTPVIYSRHGTLDLKYDIFAQPGSPTVVFIPDDEYDQYLAEYLLSNSVATLPVSLTNIQGAPSFLNAAEGNYRLRYDSLGVDFAVATQASDLDLDGNDRVWDLSSIFNQFGPQDLGAYERVLEAPPENIFSDGFEPYFSSLTTD